MLLLVLAHRPWPSTQTKQCLFPLGWRKRWMRRCPTRLGLLRQRGRKETGGALTWRVKWRSLEERGPWSVATPWTPKEEVGHGSDRTKVAREEQEKLKEDEMEVDVDAPQGESAEIKKVKKEGD